jgi:hypothetical protein
MAFTSFAPSIARHRQEGKLNFAKLPINKAKAIERSAMDAIRVFDGCRPGNWRMFARQA